MPPNMTSPVVILENPPLCIWLSMAHGVLACGLPSSIITITITLHSSDHYCCIRACGPACCLFLHSCLTISTRSSIKYQAISRSELNGFIPQRGCQGMDQ
ncbi:hypothetical protein BDV12DRAFT_103974 [Aspergillus spectabilis]